MAVSSAPARRSVYPLAIVRMFVGPCESALVGAIYAYSEDVMFVTRCVPGLLDADE